MLLFAFQNIHYFIGLRRLFTVLHACLNIEHFWQLLTAVLFAGRWYVTRQPVVQVLTLVLGRVPDRVPDLPMASDSPPAPTSATSRPESPIHRSSTFRPTARRPTTRCTMARRRTRCQPFWNASSCCKHSRSGASSPVKLRRAIPDVFEIGGWSKLYLFEFLVRYI